MTCRVAVVGRLHEQGQVNALLGRARNGRGEALFVTGEPGIGKTTLLDATSAELGGMWCLRVDGFEAESTIPFAAMHRLVAPLRGHLGSLPAAHQQALMVAVGGSEGPTPDRFLVGLGALGLLAAAGEEEPVACIVDDAHFLDSESLDVLTFVARRLAAETVALLFAGRDVPQLVTRMAGVATLRLAGLETEHAVRLLMDSLPEPIDPAAAATIATATGGNPLALVDLAADLSARRLAESSLADEPLPIGHHLEGFYLRRVRGLPQDLQQWLLVAAADSTGNLDLIQGAVRGLGLAPGTAERVEAEGLVGIDRSVWFRHPLVRSAAYNAPLGAERRRAHRALAEAAETLGLVELAAWHAAKATLGTDTHVANRLEQVADLAGRRGGSSSRAAVLSQSSALTPPGPARYRRLVMAAEAALAAGSAHVAKMLLDDVDDDSLDPVTQGRAIGIRASIAVFIGDPALMESGANMLAAAEAFHGHDVAMEQNALIKAFEFTLPAERQARGAALTDLGRRMRKAADLADGLPATILRGLSALVLLPYAEAVPDMRAAVRAISGLEPAGLLQYGSASVALTTALWDLEARRECLVRTAEAARDVGSLQLLDTTLWVMSLAELTGGSPRRAHEYISQVRELRRAIGYDEEHVVNVALLAWSGAPAAQVEVISDTAGAMGFGGVRAAGIGALATQALAHGDYATAYDRLVPLVEDPFLHVTPLELPDFVEAASRSGHADETPGPVAQLEAQAAANGSPWNLGVAHRSRALVTDDAEAHHRAAITTLETTGAVVDLARSHLIFGEWLRRVRRRREAREQLHEALRIFDGAQAPEFAARARRELAALGEQPTERRASNASELTPQEATVARLAASGQTNAEIAGTMFLSPNTVDYHLRKVFQKFGISSRRQLRDRIREDG